MTSRRQVPPAPDVDRHDPMRLLFQYGSNMSSARLNGADRLAGDARICGVARTVGFFEFGFNVWSGANSCAAADIEPCPAGRQIYGVLYEIPEHLIRRDSAQLHRRKSMDAIESEGVNYVREVIEVQTTDGVKFDAVTYLVKHRKRGLQTSIEYVRHILNGLSEHAIPDEYRRYVVSRIIANNADLGRKIEAVFPLT